MRILILGCGKHIKEKQEGHTYLDIRPFQNVDIVHDLDIQPYPIESDSYEHISAIHVVEHLRTYLIPFMDECHRILKRGGSLYLETPLAGSNIDLEFADPTHVRCYRKHSFINYFTLEGVENFGYTDKAWAIVELKEVNGNLIFHGYPIK